MTFTLAGSSVLFSGHEMRRAARRATLSVLFFAASLASFGQGKPDDCLGTWQTGNGKAHVLITRQGSEYVGRIVWLRDPTDPATGRPKLDKHNEDPARRRSPVLGVPLLQGFRWNGASAKWDNGRIYDPENGKDYASFMHMPNANTLAVRGYIGLPTLGRTDTWRRVGGR